MCAWFLQYFTFLSFVYTEQSLAGPSGRCATSFRCHISPGSGTLLHDSFQSVATKPRHVPATASANVVWRWRCVGMRCHANVDAVANGDARQHVVTATGRSTDTRTSREFLHCFFVIIHFPFVRRLSPGCFAIMCCSLHFVGSPRNKDFRCESMRARIFVVQETVCKKCHCHSDCTDIIECSAVYRRNCRLSTVVDNRWKTISSPPWTELFASVNVRVSHNPDTN